MSSNPIGNTAAAAAATAVAAAATAASAAAAVVAASPSINAGIHQTGAGQIPEIIVSQQAANATILTTAPGGATIERGIQAANETEIRRSHQRSYDEYESDDELRREDISFAIDGGRMHHSLNRLR